MKLRWRILQIALALTAAAAPYLTWAQTSNGTLVGSVVDPAGAVVSKASVSAVSAQYGVPHVTQTDPVGTYRLEGLQPGTYTVTITDSGFKTLSVTGVVIDGSLTTTINGKLELASTQQTLEIKASAAQAIDTQSGQLGENLSHQEVTQLPYSSFNPAELALTLPGVHNSPLGTGLIPNFGQTNGFAFSVNGSRPRSNNFLIDGQDDNDYAITGQAYQPLNVGAIQEVTILTNAYSAEYGRGGGSVTNYIYKSGSNNFHGDLWEINRNSAMAAIPAQDAVSNPISKNPYDNENTFGFDAGGPVIKDKLFFFGAVQWDRERESATGPVFKLPTAAGIVTLKSLTPSQVGSESNIALLLNSIGSLASPGLTGVTSIPLGNDPLSNPRPSVQIGDFQVQNVKTAINSVDWNFRMDWQITDHDTLTGSAIRDTQTESPDIFADPNALPNFQTQQGGPADIFRGQWVHTISSKLVNELRLSYQSIDFAFSQTPQTLASSLANIPYIEFGSDVGFPAIGVNSEFPQGRSHKNWEVQDALSYAAGTHTIKVGADFTILNLADQIPINTRGTIKYSSGGGYSSLGNFIDDTTGATPGTISKVFGNPNYTSNATMYAPYIQDTWRIKNNLTLDLGLRYEFWGALANSMPYPSFNVNLGFGLPGVTAASFPGMYAYKQMPDRRNFAPRLGLAYTPHWGQFLFGQDKTTIRAGYGIFYDGMFTTIVDNTAASEPNTVGGSIPAPTGRGKASASTFPGITTTPNPFLSTDTMASNLHNPLTQQWNVDVERELPLGLVLTLAYVGTRGEHLFVNQDFNSQVNYSYINPNFGEITIRSNAGDSRYDSGQVEVERKFHSDFFLRAAYTYSKFMDDTSDIELTTGTSAYSQVISNQRSDWGPSAFDQRHRFTAAYVWRLPYVHGNTLLRALTDQWQWSSIATIQSGTPNTVVIGFDNIGNGHPNSRPDLANPAAPLNSLGVDGGDFGPFPPFVSGSYYNFNCWYYGTNPCPAQPLSTFHFVVPNGRPGNAQRNSVFGPGQIYFDTSIQRDFPIHFLKQENQMLSFRTEFFNAFNHPNLFTPSYNMLDPNYNNAAITISGGRQIKFWLKFSF